MGKAIPVSLGKEHFLRKDDVIERIHSLVKSYDVMSFVQGHDKEFCLNLFKHHPRYLEKLGDGILGIQIRLDIYGNRNFHIHRNDGSDEVISWKKCLAAIK